MADIHQLRELTKDFWAGRECICPDHPGAKLEGSFVETTYADHILFRCARGNETLTIPQRPRQREYNPPQIEGLVENIQRGDNVLCYRCQSKIVMERDRAAGAEKTRYNFTCVRCLSFGSWEGTDRQAEGLVGRPAASVKKA